MTGLTEQELRSEIIGRVDVYNSWVAVYWKDLIPFAHGIRLFGIAYNDALRPKDPYEFMNLLAGTGMKGVERNRMLREMAALARSAPYPADNLRERLTDDRRFQDLLLAFMARFGDLSCGTKQCSQGPDSITELVIELASVSEDRERSHPKDVAVLERSFLARFEGQERSHAEELLDLARTSYRTRDNDNIYLGRIKGQAIMATEEYLRRFSQGGSISEPELKKAIDGISAPDTIPPKGSEKKMHEKGFRSRARQITGQPAGPGIAQGKARGIADASDLHRFKAGEALVCDAGDPSGAFLPINGSKVATGPIDAHIGVVLNGRPGTAMAAFGSQLSDADIAAIVTYQRNAWDNKVGDAAQPAQIAAARGGAEAAAPAAQ